MKIEYQGKFSFHGNSAIMSSMMVQSIPCRNLSTVGKETCHYFCIIQIFETISLFLSRQRKGNIFNPFRMRGALRLLPAISLLFIVNVILVESGEFVYEILSLFSCANFPNKNISPMTSFFMKETLISILIFPDKFVSAKQEI